MHSKKLAAALQHANETDNIILMRVTDQSRPCAGQGDFES